MQSGRVALAGIEEALRDLRGQEAALQRDLEAANRERAKLVAERLETFRRLAAIRARDAMADGVINDADNLSQQVRAILEARLKTIAQLEERHAEAESARDAHVARQDELNQHIASLEERLDAAGAEARAALVNDPVHKALAEQHASLEATREKAAAKAEQAARDENEKGLPYREDPLFMYLWRRRMGTPAYQASGLVRALDDWVAGLVRYAEARANYALLTEIPVRLRAHAEDLRRQAAAAKSQLDEMEASRTRELVGEDLVAELTAGRERQVELSRELETITSELAETGSQLKVYAKGEDQSFQSATAAYTSFLEREPLRRLLADAAATDTADDDRLVEEVRRYGGLLEELEERTSSRRRRLDQLAERKMELARLAANFRRQRYDDAGSEFDDSPRMEDLLQLLLRGAITAAEYWVRMQSQQHWRHRPGDAWRRRSGFPPFDWRGRRRRDDDDDDDDDDDEDDDHRYRGRFRTGGRF